MTAVEQFVAAIDYLRAVIAPLPAPQTPERVFFGWPVVKIDELNQIADKLASKVGPEPIITIINEPSVTAAGLGEWRRSLAYRWPDGHAVVTRYSGEWRCGSGHASVGMRLMSDAEKQELLSALAAWQAEARGWMDGGSDSDAKSKPAKAMTWQRAMKLAEAHCRRNEFPGLKALAKIVGCSPSTMSKAVDRSAPLREKLAEREAQRKSVSAGPLSDAAAASAKQTREPDPIDAAASTDDLFRRLLEQAKPSERAKLNAMTPDKRRELIALIEHAPNADRSR